ncbi:DUF2500 domain-containing protein [Enterococcus mundtii]|uniref:DUF2500 domain-containing protein n=1 Tax=Enterococcus mundtii TaxID=53346 RepID=UPI00032E19F2|nr:DUF2500 domain-containing protein [Enterococcus mundtii]EOH59641.1 hypothetical protein UAC_02777 [Enterococcus mundtii ATCC 882]EOU11548.1 hypothetical protein I587_00063 [Enterococcus mundtii ATCC 882]
MDFLFTLFVFIFIAIILYQILEFLKNESTPEISVPATLVDKSMRSSSSVDANGISNQSITYYLLFELENGERKEFRVGHGKYKLYVIGDTGILRYQRKRFNSLDR